MNFGIVVFPGSNCERDLFHACISMGCDAKFIWHEDSEITQTDVILLPGGFSFGDYLRPGAIAARSPIIKAIKDFADNGGPVIGICNGFQILCEVGLLPGILLPNITNRFICKWVWVKVVKGKTLVTEGLKEGQVLHLPIAHGDGRYYLGGENLITIKSRQQIIFQYCGPMGEEADEFNPNGSVERIAGISNEKGNVIGMMPHPERAMETLLGGEDGSLIFQAILSWVH